MSNKIKKIAVVFAGQGAQVPEMGKSLYDASPAARAVFEAAGAKVMHDCFEGTQEELNQTDVTQPAVYTVDMAAWAAFEEALEKSGEGSLGSEIEIVGMAGFSLGEYAAFTAAGVIPSIPDGIELIRRRGTLMANAGKHEDGSPRGVMAAVIGEREEIMNLLEQSRGKDVLEAVNLNAATQTVIAGDVEAIDRFAENAKDSGKKLKVMPLKVSTAFHSPIMKPAAEGIAEAASKISFCAPKYELYLDMTGNKLSDYADEQGAEAKDLIPGIMAKQVCSPVRWQNIVEALAAAGPEAIVEFGPGKTLTGLTKKTAPGVSAMNVQDVETLAQTVDAMIGGV